MISFIDLLCLGFRRDDLADIFLCLGTGHHYLMTAVLTAELEIHTAAQHQKTVAAAGMIFLHHKHIANIDIHGIALLPSEPHNGNSRH